MTNLENDLCKSLKWSKNNGMVVNPKKFQLMFLGMNTNRQLHLNIEGKKINATEHEKILGTETDSKLMFSKHVETLCYKLKKRSLLFRLNNFITTQQAISIYNAVLFLNFNHCPLIWMFCNKGANKKIDRTHKNTLQILNKDYVLTVVLRFHTIKSSRDCPTEYLHYLRGELTKGFIPQ